MATPLALSDLRAEVRRRTGVDMPTLWADVDIDRAIQQANLDLMSQEDWTFLRLATTVATVAATPTVAISALATPVNEVYGVAIVTGDNRGDLRQVTLRSKDSRHEDAVPDAGFPQEYSLSDDRTGLVLYPTPDAVYTLQVRGRKTVADISGLDTNVPVFDAEFHLILALMASVDVLEQEGDDSPRSENYIARAENILDRMRRRYQVSHDEARIQMGGRRDRNRARRYWVEGEPSYPWIA